MVGVRLWGCRCCGGGNGWPIWPLGAAAASLFGLGLVDTVVWGLRFGIWVLGFSDGKMGLAVGMLKCVFVD